MAHFGCSDYYSLAVYWWPDCSRVNNTTQLTEQQGVFSSLLATRSLIQPTDAFS